MTVAEASNPRVSSSLIPSEDAVVVDPVQRGFFQTRVQDPLVNLLRVGATPERLAWSLAVGCVIGINPIVGSTTLVCLAVAFLFRLNVVASQIANHMSFPIQLALILAWIRAGQVIFRTGPPPLAASDLLHQMRQHPWATAHMLWTWEWHAIVVWLLASVVLMPLLAAILYPALRHLLAKIKP